ncbi:MAG: DNA alkylation repair protein [Pseudomonadales bacterium]
MPTLRPPCIPKAPRAIEKGVPLTSLLDTEAVECLGHNLYYVDQNFDIDRFMQLSLAGLEPLSLMQRGKHIANALHNCLPQRYDEAIAMLIASMPPERPYSEDFGLAGFFYLPHSFYIAEYGRDPSYNQGEDPFDSAVRGMLALTVRFSAEFAIRDFLIERPEHTLKYIEAWLTHESPHVRRLCSEGTRPKLPWGKQLKAFISDPSPTLPILEALKDDPALYVRRSVANHLGDIAKNHPERVFDICERWLVGASDERKWLIRHALRHPAKKKLARALAIRSHAK